MFTLLSSLCLTLYWPPHPLILSVTLHIKHKWAVNQRWLMLLKGKRVIGSLLTLMITSHSSTPTSLEASAGRHSSHRCDGWWHLTPDEDVCSSSTHCQSVCRAQNGRDGCSWTAFRRWLTVDRWQCDHFVLRSLNKARTTLNTLALLSSLLWGNSKFLYMSPSEITEALLFNETKPSSLQAQNS